MSVSASQPSAPLSAAEPALIVSDIPAPQPQPAVSSPALVYGNTSAASPAGTVATIRGPAPPSVPAPPSHGPSPSTAPSHLPPAATAVQHTVPAPAGTAPNVVQYRGPALQPSARPLPPSPPHVLTSHHYQTYSHQPVYPASQPAPVIYQRQPPQPAPQPSYQPQSSRPLIVDPPRKRSSLGLAVAMPQPHSASPGFPSPSKDYPSAFPKFSDDLSRITLAIKQSVPEAVRQGVRDNWEKCVLGSEFHQAFVLNASMHHSTPGVQNRAVHDFGGSLVANCKSELIGHFSARDIDDVADLILAKASNAFLDKALEMRLATIDAKPLLNALAQAERLGYGSQDLVEVSQGEHVIPNTGMAHIPAPNMGAGAANQAVRSTGSRAAAPNELQCLKCYRTFTKRSHFDYHMSRTVCSKVPPTVDGFRYACSKCGQGFTHPGGLTYHNAHGVCEGGSSAPESELKNGGLPATPVPVRNTASPAHRNPTQAPSSSQIAKSATASVLPANRPGDVPSPSKSSPAGDPYGHLTQAQMDRLNAELLQAEQQYSGRFTEAEAIADPEQRRVRLDSLRNTFGTKQSMIRKRYGVRLRERRTRAEIEAERERMGLRGRKTDTASQSPAPTQQPPRSTTASTASGWTAANRVAPTDLTDDSTPSLKRRRVDEGGDEYPQQQTGPTTKVSEMAGGLGASAATAAIHDPTLPPTSTPARTYQQAGARVEIHLPSNSNSPTKPVSGAGPASGGLSGTASREDSMTPDGMDVDHESPSAQLQEQERDDGNIKADHDEEDEEEEEEAENEVINIDDDSEDDDDDGDIPSSLPPSARQSLGLSQHGSHY